MPVLAEAASAARRGDYGAAERILAELDRADPAVLDLLARVHAQQGHLTEAEECWQRMEAAGGDAAAAVAGRNRIAALRRRPRYGRAAAVGVLAGVVVVAAGVVGGVLAGSGSQPDGLAREVGDLSTQVSQLRARPDPVVVRQDQVLTRLVGALGGVGTLSRSSGQLTVTFPVPVFSSYTALSGAGQAALVDVGQRLRGFAGQVTVTVVGHTDDVGTSNDDLGLARAVAAAGVLAGASGQPLSSFDLATNGSVDPPYSDATADGRAMNRTVTVTMSPR